MGATIHPACDSREETLLGGEGAGFHHGHAECEEPVRCHSIGQEGQRALGLGSGAESPEPQRPVEGMRAGGGEAQTGASQSGERAENKPEITNAPKTQGGKEPEKGCLKSQEGTRAGAGE